MANVRMLAQNLDRYTLTATSTNTNYPLSNLKTGFNFDLWKSASTAETQVLTINLGVPYAITALIFDAHNFEALGLGEGESVLISYSDNGSSWTAYDNIATFTTDPLLKTITSATHQYWRISFDKATALSTYPEIGNLFIGKLLDFGRPNDLPMSLFGKRFNTSVGFGGTGVMRTSNQYGGRAAGTLNFKGEKGGLTDTVITDFQSLFNLCEGRLRPLYFIDYFDVIRCIHFDTDQDPSEKLRYDINDLPIPVIGQQAT